MRIRAARHELLIGDLFRLNAAVAPERPAASLGDQVLCRDRRTPCSDAPVRWVLRPPRQNRAPLVTNVPGLDT